MGEDEATKASPWLLVSVILLGLVAIVSFGVVFLLLGVLAGLIIVGLLAVMGGLMGIPAVIIRRQVNRAETYYGQLRLFLEGDDRVQLVPQRDNARRRLYIVDDDISQTITLGWDASTVSISTTTAAGTGIVSLAQIKVEMVTPLPKFLEQVMAT